MNREGVSGEQRNSRDVRSDRAAAGLGGHGKRKLCVRDVTCGSVVKAYDRHWHVEVPRGKGSVGGDKDS